MEQVIQFLLAALPVAATLAGVWLGDRNAARRLRLELAAQERRHRAELKARFVDSLLAPRIQAHQAVLGAMLDLRVAAHYFIPNPQVKEYRDEFVRARDAFRIASNLHAIWIRTPALEQLSAIDKMLDETRLGDVSLGALQQEFAKAETRLRWSLGAEDLEFYMRDLWKFDLQKDAPDA